MSKKNDKKDDPLYCINKAEKYLNPGFFDAMFKSKRERLEDAIELYENAAQIYIEQKDYLKSAECQLKCAWIKEQLKDDPTYSYLEALNCYKRTENYDDYQKTLDKCISSYLKEGKYNDAAKLEYDRGKLYEYYNKTQEAFDSYEKALDFYEMDKSEMKGAIKEVKIAKANLICSNDMKDLITEAKALFEEIGDELTRKNPSIKNKKDEEKEEELKKDKTYKHYAEVDLTLSVDIKELLEKMCSFVSIKRIVNKVAESSKEATLREFKELLLKMLNSYSNLTKILDSAKQLLSNSVIINENELIRLSNKGNEIILRKCDQCHKEFKKSSKNENIIVFKCGHLMHESCVADENEELECKICRKNEIDSSIVTIRSRGSSKINRDNDSNNTSSTNFKSDDDEEKSEEKKEMFHKWRAFDKRNLQMKKMLIDNSIKIFTEYKAKDTITPSD